MSHRLRVGVLRGGPSAEYEVSLNSGAEVLRAINEYHSNKFRALDIFIDKKGNWHINGLAIKPEQAIHQIDIACNALHGNYGEDGKIQNFLEAHNVPFTGSGSLGSAIGMNKIMTKKIFNDHNIKTPQCREILSKDISTSVQINFLLPSSIIPF